MVDMALQKPHQTDDNNAGAQRAVPLQNINAWFQLMRPPNLFTVPGDPLVGFLLAGAAVTTDVNYYLVIPCIAASLLLYISGLFFNDYFDREEDARDRPTRPIPSGRVKAGSVLAVAVVLMLIAIIAASLAGLYCAFAAGALAVLILLYSIGGKCVPVIGPLNMGLCRGLSLLLGAAAVLQVDVFGSSVIVIAALGITFYIAAVTRIAAKETEETDKRDVPVSLMILIALFFAGIYIEGWPIKLPLFGASLVTAFAAFAWIMINSIRVAAASPEALQKIIGNLIRGLLLIEAGLAVTVYWQGLVAAAVLVAFFPLSSLAARKFYAS